MSLKPQCPAARAIEGVVDGAGGIICQIMREDERAGDGILEGDAPGVFLSERSDPYTVTNLCCGDGTRVVENGTSRNYYTSCPIWVAEQKRLGERKNRTFAPLDRPSASPDPELVERGILRPDDTGTARIGELV